MLTLGDMYTKLGDVQLKTGETVEAGVVHGPDPAWADRLSAFLGHKTHPYSWQINRLLTEDLAVDAWFYILHRQGQPLSHILTIEQAGVGILGHVYTQPADRRKSATTVLMDLQMSHFRNRGGRAMYLGTGYDTPPYHIYSRFGFADVYARSGLMGWFSADAQAFERSYFHAGATTIEPLHWRHYPSSTPLFIGGYPGVVRCAAVRLCGRYLCEGPLLHLLHAEATLAAQSQPPHAFVSRLHDTGAIVGLASCHPDPLWPGVCVLDVYCHPAFWSEAPRLLERIPTTSGKRLIAYADSQTPQRSDALRAAGFTARGTLFTGFEVEGCDPCAEITVYERP